MDYISETQHILNNLTDLGKFKHLLTATLEQYVIEGVLVIEMRTNTKNNVEYHEFNVKYKDIELGLSVYQKKTLFLFINEKYDELIMKQLPQLF